MRNGTGSPASSPLDSKGAGPPGPSRLSGGPLRPGPRRAARGIVAAAAAALSLLAHPARGAEGTDPVLWPEHQRTFLQDGPALLLGAAQRSALLQADEEGREALIRGFLDRDPLPGTPVNELAEAIRRRRALVRSEFVSPLDDRARILFLHGRPSQRLLIDCGLAFKPLEVWSYDQGAAAEPHWGDGIARLVLYQPEAGRPYRLWTPLDSKRDLYTPEMEYFLEQWEALQGRVLGLRRLDLQVCEEAAAVDRATGIGGLRGRGKHRPTVAALQSFLAPPGDLAAWARRAAETPLPEGPPPLAAGPLEVSFPREQGQRLVARILVKLPAEGKDLPVSDGETGQFRLVVEGVIEHQGEIFEELRVRFEPDPPAGKPLALVLERPLRPRRNFLARLRIRDEIGGGRALVTRGFRVPEEPEEVPEPGPEGDFVIALGHDLARAGIGGEDSLLLVPPATEVVLGLWRAEALVSGSRIRKVVFLVDGQPQLTRNRPPFTAELRLADQPREQVVRAEGFDLRGELVAADELVVNQPRGAFQVEILEPPRGYRGAGEVTARVRVAVPVERRVEAVEFRLNDQLAARAERPPWTARLEVPAEEEITYLTAVAILDDGRRAEAVRFLNAPRYLEEVEVTLVELYTTVVEPSGRPVKGLTKEDFRVFEDGRPQEIARFEHVSDLPLTVGIAIDTSSSMSSSLAAARQAGQEFLGEVMKRGDRCFVVGFADRPVLLMPPTGDPGACHQALGELRAVGWTTLHDAVVTALYYFRAMEGQRALIVLSDGDDTRSTISFQAAEEYARRSGVAIYTIGLGISVLDFDARGKLKKLAGDTGGRSFFVGEAEELAGAYGEIEEELRSRYFLAYSPDRPSEDGAYRDVEVKVRGGRLKARTQRGDYP